MDCRVPSRRSLVAMALLCAGLWAGPVLVVLGTGAAMSSTPR